MNHLTPDIKVPEDLAAWRRSGELFDRLVEELGSSAPPWPAGQLGEELVRQAASLRAGVAAAWQPADPAAFAASLREPLATCRRMRALLQSALKVGLLEAAAARRLTDLADATATSLRELARYLANTEIKRKYRELDEW